MQSKLFNHLSICLLLVCTLYTVPSQAAKLGIGPIKLLLWPEQKSDAVQVSNEGNESVNIQVLAKTWDMDENGKFIETDTGDFVFFPRLLTIAPNEKKSVRVGYNGDFPAQEKPYRLYIEELPPVLPPDQQEQGLGVRYQLRLSLPIFVMPGKEPPQPQMEVDSVTAGEKIVTLPPQRDASGKLSKMAPEPKTEKVIKVGVKAPGNFHVQVIKVELHWLGAEDKVVATTEAKAGGLRVLPKRRMFVDVPLPESCQGVQNLVVKVYADRLKEPYTQKFLVTDSKCYP